MAIFKSQQVNLDPEPWLVEDYDGWGRQWRQATPGVGDEISTWAPRREFEPTRDPEPWARDDGWRTSGGFHLEGRGYGWAPRREQFDTPVNRVLLHLRKKCGDIYELMFDLDSRWVEGFTYDEVCHARKVLDRLANWRVDA